MRLRLIAFFICCSVMTPGVLAGKFYLGAGAGSTSAELGTDTRVNFDATGFKGFVGYEAMRYFAVELSYTDFGDLDESSGVRRFQGDAQAAALWGIGILPVTPRLGLYARLGYSAYDSEVSETDGNNPPTIKTDDGYDLAWGFGFSYNFTRSWGLRLEWENYRFEDSDKVTFTSLSITVRF
jgi:opacity protein-like surface antigen